MNGVENREETKRQIKKRVEKTHVVIVQMIPDYHIPFAYKKP